jgi:ABC-type multidrug transport system fused ATPase/permease subunit
MNRFYDLDKGRILLNGKDATDINLYEYRKYFSLVAQEATLFQGTLRENILLGVDPSSVKDEQLHRACRDASIHEFIVSLPEGYNTNIGSRGVSLSGGQKQRVAIARALIRDPKVLLLDEATSSLDSESEKLVQAAFERASEGRTMLVVAHRLATVQNADVIFVLGDGQLLEQGSHVELLKKRGVYWHMVSCFLVDLTPFIPDANFHSAVSKSSPGSLGVVFIKECVVGNIWLRSHIYKRRMLIIKNSNALYSTLFSIPNLMIGTSRIDL